MKLFIASAALACFLCVLGCNSNALRSVSASLAAQGGQTPKDEYKLSTDSKKDKTKSISVPFSHVNHATKNYSVDGTKAHRLRRVPPHRPARRRGRQAPAAQVRVPGRPHRDAHGRDRQRPEDAEGR